MSQKAHHDDYYVHAHVTDTKIYAGILGTLLLLTLLTVAVYNVRLGAANLIVAILIATVKASLVVFYFMHMKYETKFNVLLFLGSLAFGGIFLAYTMNDTSNRGSVDPWSGSWVDRSSGFSAQGGLGAGGRLSAFKLSADGCSEGTWPAGGEPPWPCSWFAWQEARDGSSDKPAVAEDVGDAEVDDAQVDGTGGTETQDDSPDLNAAEAPSSEQNTKREESEPDSSNEP
ncbi:MAG: cytochrome C oxidase subunit IV family protein [Myxococcota bacterium]